MASRRKTKKQFDKDWYAGDYHGGVPQPKSGEVSRRKKKIMRTIKRGWHRAKRRASNPGSNWLGTIAIIGGGYILLRAIGIDPIALIENALGITTSTTVPVTTGTTPQANTTTTTPVTTNTTNTTQTSSTGTMNQVLAAAVAGGVNPTSNQSFDIWNYYYNQVRGIAGPDPGTILTVADRNELMGIQEWWGYMQSAGFSGLGGLGGRYGFGGLGIVANMSPYTGGVGGPLRGQAYPLLGSETYAKFLY